MISAWPATLPKPVFAPEHERADAAVRTDIDFGAQTARRRQTRTWLTLDARFILDAAQYAAFDALFKTTLNAGASWFTADWLQDMGFYGHQLRFAEPPRYSIAGISPTQLIWQAAARFDLREDGTLKWEKRAFDPPGIPFDATLGAAASGPDIVLTIAGLAQNSLDDVPLGSYAYLSSDEVLRVTGVDSANSQITVSRGMLDTVPVAQNSGLTISFVGAVGNLVLTGTNRDQKPYPPGNVTLNGQAWPTIGSITGGSSSPASYGEKVYGEAVYGEPVAAAGTQPLSDLTVAWAHRDRTDPNAAIITQSSGDVGPEPGTTYTLRFYKSDSTLLKTVTGLTGTSYLYTAAQMKTDNGGADVFYLRVQLESVRGGFTSWQYQERAIGAL